jgi:branched-chain amino acid aminotransferase
MTRPRYAYFRGQCQPYDDVRIGLLTHALNYGTGAFAGMRGYWNDEEQQLFVFRPQDHARRLLQSARLLRMSLPQVPDDLVRAMLELLRAENLRTDCYVRGLVFYSDEVIGVRLQGLTPELSFVAIPFGLYIEKAEGAHLGTSSWRRVDDNTIPPRGKITGAYANSAFIKSDAELAGFDEALVLNQAGQVSEGSAENVFLVRNGKVVTPPVTSSILEGITRASVITLLQAELGLEVVERPIERTEIYLADEVFLTGTAAQVTAATRIDHRAIGTGEMGPITGKLRKLFEGVVRGRVTKYRGWCEGVYGGAARNAHVGDATRKEVVHAHA